MNRTLCMCADYPRLHTRTRLVLVAHHTEIRKPSNSGRVGVRCLANSEMVVRGLPDQPSNALSIQDGMQPVLLFPHDEARPLNDLGLGTAPVCLIVPDGNWRQAGKVRQRVPGLADIPCAVLPNELVCNYRLRAQGLQMGLGTLEAIAYAFGILEGPEIQSVLERVHRMMVERTLWLRGRISSAQVTDGLPKAAIDDDPRGRH